MPSTAAAARSVETEWGTPGSPALCLWHDLDVPAGGGSALQAFGRVLARDYGLHVVSARIAEGNAPTASVLDLVAAEQAVVMGHGRGGALACRIASSSPERVSALVLLEGGHSDTGDFHPSDVYPAVRAAGLPVLLLTATEPPELAARNEPWIERFHDALPDADVQRMPGWGHDLIADGGPVLAHVVGGWLTSVGLEPPQR